MSFSNSSYSTYCLFVCVVQCFCCIPKEIVVGMRFGRFGREDNSLVLIGQGGALSVKILRRGVVFEPKEATPG